jgi:hypothetical protein
MPRFVILQHDHPTMHWDLLLEAGPILRAWRLTSPPADGQTTAAEANFDHRPFYLDYEGPVSGGRGSIQRWDAGEFTWIENVTDRLSADIRGGRIRGTIVLERLHDSSWRLSFTRAPSI